MDIEQLNQRLQQRLGYLQQDRDNAALYADTVDLAISLAQWETVNELLLAAPSTLSSKVLSNYQAVAFLAQGKSQLALDVLQPLLQDAGPDDQMLAYNAAYALALLGDAAQAEQTLRHYPTGLLNDDTTRLLMHVLMMQGRVQDARAVGQAYWEAGRSEPGALGIFALTLVDENEFSLAIDVANRALAQMPDAQAWCALGTALLGTDSAEQAQPCFEQALRLDARQGRAWLGLGMCQATAGELEAARKTLLRATELNLEHPGSWQVLGWTLLSLYEIGAAEAAFNKALQADRNFGDSHGALGVICVLRGRIEEAEHYAAVALRLDPHSAAGYFAKALIADSQGDTQKARTIVDGLLNSKHSDGRTLFDAVTRLRQRSS